MQIREPSSDLQMMGVWVGLDLIEPESSRVSLPLDTAGSHVLRNHCCSCILVLFCFLFVLACSHSESQIDLFIAWQPFWWRLELLPSNLNTSLCVYWMAWVTSPSCVWERGMKLWVGLNHTLTPEFPGMELTLLKLHRSRLKAVSFKALPFSF